MLLRKLFVLMTLAVGSMACPFLEGNMGSGASKQAGGHRRALKQHWRTYDSRTRDYPHRDRTYPQRDRTYPQRDRTYPQRDRTYPQRDHTRDYPKRDRRDYPRRDRVASQQWDKHRDAAWIQRDWNGGRNDEPAHMMTSYAPEEFVQVVDYPSEEYPQQEYPQEEYPQEGYPDPLQQYPEEASGYPAEQPPSSVEHGFNKGSTSGVVFKTRREAIASLDLEAVRSDLATLLRTSQEFWPADFGYYGGLMIRLAWHSAGSYRVWDGRGGMDGARMRFAPELDWGENANLDKAMELLVPIKEKYGDALSWGDLIALVGKTAIVEAGGPKLGFCAGRIDDVDGEESLPLGPHDLQEEIAPCETEGDCSENLGATAEHSIYVNAEGPQGIPDPVGSAPEIRSTFARMGMNDSETVALIGGGHAIGKMHGACSAGPGKCGSGPLQGKGPNTVTSGFEGTWIENPTTWTNDYFKNLLEYFWEKRESPMGRIQWIPILKPDSDEEVAPPIIMLTTDIALLEDESYLAIVEKYATDLEAFDHAFKHAWYKLESLDIGSHSRCLGPEVPPPQPWQCPLPPPPEEIEHHFESISDEIKALLTKSSEHTMPDLVEGTPYFGALFSTLAWRCASTYRQTDFKGGCDGARIRFSPQKDWHVNKGLDKVLQVLQPIKDKYPALSYADLIVLAGTAAIEEASGKLLTFCGMRTDADAGCDEDYLAPREYPTAVAAVKDNARVMGLSLREYVALAAQLRSAEHQKLLGYSGSWSADSSVLGNEYYKVLLEETWEQVAGREGLSEYKAAGKEGVWMMGSDVAMIEDGEIEAIVQEYAENEEAWWVEFASGWIKLMNADRYDGPDGSLCA